MRAPPFQTHSKGDSTADHDHISREGHIVSPRDTLLKLEPAMSDYLSRFIKPVLDHFVSGSGFTEYIKAAT